MPCWTNVADYDLPKNCRWYIAGASIPTFAGDGDVQNRNGTVTNCTVHPGSRKKSWQSWTEERQDQCSRLKGSETSRCRRTWAACNAVSLWPARFDGLRTCLVAEKKLQQQAGKDSSWAKNIEAGGTKAPLGIAPKPPEKKLIKQKFFANQASVSLSLSWESWLLLSSTSSILRFTETPRRKKQTATVQCEDHRGPNGATSDSFTSWTW